MSNFFDILVQFFNFSDPNVRFVVLGLILIGICSGMVGSFMVLRRQALVGDVVAHAVLPGICIAFLATGDKNTLALLAGALATGWLAVAAVNVISSRSRIKSDTALGIVLSFFFGGGMMLLTYIQHSGNAAQSGLDRFLFGKAASLLPSDLQLYMVVCALVLLVLLLFFKPFSLIAFDAQYAQTLGLPLRFYNIVLSAASVLTIVAGIQAVGVVLMAALLIIPTVAARYWTDHLPTLVLLSAIVGAVASVLGAFVSYLLPDMPTGPWIVVILTLLLWTSVLIAPKKGWLFKNREKRQYQHKMLTENILKTLYMAGERSNDFLSFQSLESLKNLHSFTQTELQAGLKYLERKNSVLQKNNNWRLSQEGMQQGKRIVRLHRLWELYMQRYLKLPPDHLHETAEAIEHALTPELERELEKLLEYPKYDPHDKQIPY